MEFLKECFRWRDELAELTCRDRDRRTGKEVVLVVAQTISLPNIRKFFIPDPGMIIAECDLSGADAQVVAWEAGDEELKTAFRQGLKIHIKNCRDMFPDKVRGWSDEAIKATGYSGGLYHNNKQAVQIGRASCRERV